MGLFCSVTCSHEFRLSGEITFSLLEWERLHFPKWRFQNGVFCEENQVAS